MAAVAAYAKWNGQSDPGGLWTRHIMPPGSPFRYQRRAPDGTVYETTTE